MLSGHSSGARRCGSVSRLSHQMTWLVPGHVQAAAVIVDVLAACQAKWGLAEHERLWRWSWPVRARLSSASSHSCAGRVSMVRATVRRTQLASTHVDLTLETLSLERAKALGAFSGVLATKPPLVHRCYGVLP